MVGAGKPGKCRETLSKKEKERKKEINEIKSRLNIQEKYLNTV